MPALTNDPDWVVLPAFRPGPEPTAVLARALTVTAHQLDLNWTVAFTRSQLDRSDGLAQLAEELLVAGFHLARHRLLVTVDQAEELLTVTADDPRATFVGLLRAAMPGPVQVVATLRSEFLDPLLAEPALTELPVTPVPLRPLARDLLPGVIEGPARLAGIGVDTELVARLVADTGTGDALPLLAFTLQQLAAGVSRGGCLSLDRYQELGGVQGALLRQANAALAEAMAGSGRTRKEVIAGLLRLVAVDEQGRPTRRRVPREELRVELNAFFARRLLATDTATGDPGDGAVLAEVAHEAFLSAWPPLRHAIEDSRASLRLRFELEREAANWDRGRRDQSYLLRSGRRLTAFERWAGSHNDKLTTTLEREFLQASRALASTELETWQQSHQNRRKIARAVARRDPVEAQRLLRELLLEQERVLGQDHPDTLYTRHDLAYLIEQANSSAEKPDDEHYRMMAKGLVSSAVVPFLGDRVNLCGRPASAGWALQGKFLPSSNDLAAYLAQEVDYPFPDRTDLLRVSQYCHEYAGQLYLDELLRRVFAPKYPPTQLHRLLASLPARIRDAGGQRFPLIVTTNYDDALERAFAEAGESYDLVVTHIVDGFHGQKFRHTTTRFDSSGVIEVPAPRSYSNVGFDERPVIAKLIGGVTHRSEQRNTRFVVTEEDHYAYLSHTDLKELIPVTVPYRMNRRLLLFLGYSLRDRGHQMILYRLLRGGVFRLDRNVRGRSWAVESHPRQIDESLWDGKGVEQLNVRLDEYVDLLGRELDNQTD